MPNWGENFCMEHSIACQRQGAAWYAYNAEHCYHPTGSHLVCCWRGHAYQPHVHGEHGPHARSRPQTKQKR